MLPQIHLNRRFYIFIISMGALILLASALVSVFFYSASYSDAATTAHPSQQGLLGGFIAYHGPLSLEARIVGRDTIARVKLLSVAQVVEELNDFPPTGKTVYTNALEFKFEALEYLRGSGGSELVAVVYDWEATYNSKEEAAASGEDFLSGRSTRWDDREAIVFLSDGAPRDGQPYLSSPKQTDRYLLSSLRYFGEDNYTIASPHSRMWLPAESAASGLFGASDGSEQSFLLEEPSNGEGALGAVRSLTQSSESSTITLAELKSLIAELDAEIAAGDGSDEYWECVYHKYV